MTPNGTNGHANGHHKNGTNGHVETNGHANRIKTVRVTKATPPPQNLEAEIAVIGAMAIDNAAIPVAASITSAGDFFRESHQILFTRLTELHAADGAVDTITLEEDLRRRGELAKVGGTEGLLDLIEKTIHPANVALHARIVREKAQARELIAAAEETIGEAYAQVYSAEELAERAAGRVTRAQARDAAQAPPADVRAATLADIRRIAGEARWLWEGWILEAHMTVLAAEPGTGKTRMALDLCRRMWHCEPWPDGTDARRPLHTPSLWVASDRNHAELIHAAEEMGLPDDAIYLNADPDDPTGGLKLDERADVERLARRIELVRPGLVVIDTINKATRRLLYRPEEAEAFFGPLLDVAMRTGTAILGAHPPVQGGRSARPPDRGRVPDYVEDGQARGRRDDDPPPAGRHQVERPVPGPARDHDGDRG